MSHNDDNTTIDHLLTESEAAREPSTDRHEPASGPASEPVSETTSAPVGPSPGQPATSSGTWAAVPEFKSGPAPTTSVIGFLGLLAALGVLLSQATDLDIAWGVVGPVAVVGAGALLVVLGLAGLRGQRFRG